MFILDLVLTTKKVHSNGRSGDHDLVADLFVLFILDLVLTTKKAHSNGRLGDHDFVVLGNWKCRQRFVSVVCIVRCILIVHLGGMFDNVCVPVLSCTLWLSAYAWSFLPLQV